MAVGQAALPPEPGYAPMAALEARLEQQERARSAAHAAQLRTLLEMLALDRAAGLALSTPAQAALLMSCSETRASELLTQATVLEALPGGLAALDDGRLTVEQARTVTRTLVALPTAVGRQVWRQLLEQLGRDAQQGVVRLPRRLQELLDRLVLAADPDGAVDRRRQLEDDGDVTYERHDGVVDLHAFGLTPPNAQAALSNIAARSRPAGAWDERTAGQRRRDALVDLLTGRDPLFSCSEHDPDGACGDGTGCSGRPGTCGCPLGAPVPCGAGVQVLVPLATALGASDEPAELVGHGPVHADLLQQLLLAAPVLRAVFVDENGVPVAMSDQTRTPERGDPASLLATLLRLAGLAPGERFFRSPGDYHPPGESRVVGGDPPDKPDGDPPPGPDDGGSTGPPTGGPPPTADHRHDDVAGRERRDELLLAQASLGRILTPAERGHPAGQPGSYRTRPRLRRFLQVRRPRCEWPGCGVRAVRCDLDHDVPWPDGATCACNLGPLCRRHHRIKQTGWTKLRLPDGSVRWTSPTGRAWTSPAPHPAPPSARPTCARRRSGAVPPAWPEREDWTDDPADPRWEGLDADPAWLTADPDVDPRGDVDAVGEALRRGETRWTLDLRDPWAWG